MVGLEREVLAVQKSKNRSLRFHLFNVPGLLQEHIDAMKVSKINPSNILASPDMAASSPSFSSVGCCCLFI